MYGLVLEFLNNAAKNIRCTISLSIHYTDDFLCTFVYMSVVELIYIVEETFMHYYYLQVRFHVTRTETCIKNQIEFMVTYRHNRVMFYPTYVARCRRVRVQRLLYQGKQNLDHRQILKRAPFFEPN